MVALPPGAATVGVCLPVVQTSDGAAAADREIEKKQMWITAICDFLIRRLLFLVNVGNLQINTNTTVLLLLQL